MLGYWEILFRIYILVYSFSRIFFSHFFSERVIYARRPDGGKNPEAGYTIDEGEPIDAETACVSSIFFVKSISWKFSWKWFDFAF